MKRKKNRRIEKIGQVKELRPIMVSAPNDGSMLQPPSGGPG
jgi:hypothetical protein